MPENNLFQFAQVIAELPIHSSQHDPRLNQLEQRYAPIRKNACIVCSICFTCSKYYGVDCTCQELQPRRGKNLPEGGLDSRAKKLHPEDHDDYEFSIKWISENAHNIYKDEHDTIVGLRELSEVSLCKAHSSTLYRAKKRHERSKNQAPPSPADSIKTTARQSQFMNPYNNNHSMTGGLAAKVRELAYNQSNKHNPFRIQETTPPMSTTSSSHFDTGLSHSHSVKRKRTFKQPSPEPFTTSMSTPIYTTTTTTNSNGITPSRPNYSHHLPPHHHHPQQQQQQQQQQQHHHHHFAPPITNHNSINHIKQEQQQQLQFHSQQQQQQQQQQQIVDSFSSQLPPLQTRGVGGIGYSSSPSSSNPNNNNNNNNSNMMFRMIETPQPSPLMPQSPPQQPLDLMMVETVSLKSLHSGEYYFRNLAITENFTFRDLLAEIEITGSPPPGKRIVITNEDITYPMDQPIQSVLKKPGSTHVELCLGLLDQPSINWREYNIEQ